MKHQINSTMIKTIEHKDNSLEVEFSNGSVYQYPECSEEEFNTLLNAESVGKHFNANFRNRSYNKV